MNEDETRTENALSWQDIVMAPSELKTLENDSIQYIRNYRKLEDFSRILPPLLSKSQ